jgi:hypothetical protein
MNEAIDELMPATVHARIPTRRVSKGRSTGHDNGHNLVLKHDLFLDFSRTLGVGWNNLLRSGLQLIVWFVQLNQ